MTARQPRSATTAACRDCCLSHTTSSDGLRRLRRPAWFWIAIIGGCFALLLPILLIIAVAVPQILKVKKVADEDSAIADHANHHLGRGQL